MDCKVLNCENNNGYGYCECINYITLDENGCCESMFVQEMEGEKALAERSKG